MSKVEEPVTNEPAKPAIGNDAFAAARAAIAAQSKDQGAPADEAPASDDTSTKTPTQEAETVADESSEATQDSEDALLSAEELAALSPKERAQAEKWQAKLTKRAQALSAQSKQYDEWKPLIDGFTADPDGTLEELAKSRGFQIAKPASQDTAVKTEIQSVFAEAVNELTPELRPLFQPALEKLGRTILGAIEGKLKPIAEAQSVMISKSAAAETEAMEKAFEAKYPDYRKVESQMLELGKKFVPVAGTITPMEYMEHLYALAKAKQTKAEQVKETVKQINKSVGSIEPNTPGVSEARVEQTMPANWGQMTERERMRAAFDAASKGIIWKK